MTERPYRKKNHQVVDPEVSRMKFERETQACFRSAESNQKRGIFIISAEWPVVRVLFSTNKVRPWMLLFEARIDFTNYDIDPPSVMFVNPFDGKPLTFGEMGNPFYKFSVTEGQANGQELLVRYSDNDVPFFCIEGVREYHYHPAHTGNSWLLHRQRGKGTLGFLIDQIYTHGVAPVSGLNLNVQIIGLQFSPYL